MKRVVTEEVKPVRNGLWFAVEIVGDGGPCVVAVFPYSDWGAKWASTMYREGAYKVIEVAL